MPCSTVVGKAPSAAAKRPPSVAPKAKGEAKAKAAPKVRRSQDLVGSTLRDAALEQPRMAIACPKAKPKGLGAMAPVADAKALQLAGPKQTGPLPVSTLCDVCGREFSSATGVMGYN